MARSSILWTQPSGFRTVEIGSPLKPVEVGQVGVVAQTSLVKNRLSVMSNPILAGRQAEWMRPKPKPSKPTTCWVFGSDLLDQADTSTLPSFRVDKGRVAISQQMMQRRGSVDGREPFSGLGPLAVDATSPERSFPVSGRAQDTIIVTHDIKVPPGACATTHALGRDRDADGKVIPGARIQEEIDSSRKLLPGIKCPTST